MSFLSIRFVSIDSFAFAGTHDTQPYMWGRYTTNSLERHIHGNIIAHISVISTLCYSLLSPIHICPRIINTFPFLRSTSFLPNNNIANMNVCMNNTMRCAVYVLCTHNTHAVLCILMYICNIRNVEQCLDCFEFCGVCRWHISEMEGEKGKYISIKYKNKRLLQSHWYWWVFCVFACESHANRSIVPCGEVQIESTTGLWCLMCYYLGGDVWVTQRIKRWKKTNNNSRMNKHWENMREEKKQLKIC